MEIARKGLTRLLCLLGKGSQQHQLHRAAASKRPFEKPVVKGWLRRGCALHVGAGGKRGIPAQQSSPTGDGSCFTLLCRRLSPTGSTDWPVLGTICVEQTVLGAGLWRRTGARLKAYLHCVSAEFLCWSSKEVTVEQPEERASQPYLVVHERGRFYSSIATPLHSEC